MKNIKYSALVAIAAIAASCAKESTVIEKETVKDIPMEPMCIQTGDESETKTLLDGKTVKWTEGDQIAVFSNINDYSKGYDFPAADIKGNTATFSGKVPAGTESFFAVYPPDKVSSASASGAVVTIPSVQDPAEGTFGEELNITIAKGTKTPGTPNVGTIRFRNVCSYVKFTVPAYVSDVKSVTISSNNAIAGDLTVDYTRDDPSSTITANGKTSISMSGSFGADKTFIFVIAPGKVSNFKIDITTVSDKNWTRTISQDFTATAGKPVNLGTVDFKIASMTATATHTCDGETLTGTNLVIKNLNIPDGLTGYVKKVHIDIIPEGKTKAVRWADITDFSNQTSIAVAGNSKEYPYLPKGNYTIKSTYTMSDGTTRRETTGSFPVPAPEFIVNTPSAYTNYNTYINSGAEAANGQDGSTIFDIKNNGVKISDDILSKYASLIGEGGGYSYTIDGNSATAGDNDNQTWGEHKVFAKFTFDNVTVESPALICHVTGLPYTAAPPTNSGKHPWSATRSSTNVDWNGDNVQLNAARSTSGNLVALIQSPTFHLPTNINIASESTVIMRSNSSRYDTTLIMYIGGNKSFIQTCNKTSETPYNEQSEGTLTTSKPYIEFEAYRPVWPTSIDNYYAKVFSVELKYN